MSQTPGAPPPPPSVTLEKLPTGIPGFDHISLGGLPRGRTTLVAGTAGSAKTVFAAQFLSAGVARGEPGVFVTFEESAADIRRNMAGFGWDIPAWEAEGRWAFVDASPQLELVVEAGPFDLGALWARVVHAVERVGARRVAIDALGSVFQRFDDQTAVRAELHRLGGLLKTLDVTTVMTGERSGEEGEIARYQVEEFVADNVILLRNVRDEERRRRTMEILKFRGTDHQKGEFPFSVLPHGGVHVIPLSAMELKQKSSNDRISTGNPDLDAMCGGGFFRDSVVLVSGATGTGKTLLTTSFVAGGATARERCLVFAFEESRDQLFRNAQGWGIDFERMEREGLLRVVCEYPEVVSLEDHLLRMKDAFDAFRPQRFVLDSLSALERVASARAFREFVIGLVSFAKERQVATVLTSTTPSLTGGSSVTEAHISSITDSILLLRYVELFGEMRRSLAVLKMRGSPHDKQFREYTIDGQGLHVGRAFRNVAGILAGNPVHAVQQGELDRLGGLFPEE